MPAKFAIISIGGGPPPANLLLDDYPARAGYSFARKLRSGYIGSAFRVRRFADSATLDVGYDGNDDVDLTALTNFIGSDTASIQTLYDNGVNGFDLAATTTSEEPLIASAGSLFTINSKLSAFFNGANHTLERSDALGFTGNPDISILHIIQADSTSGFQRRIFSLGNDASVSGQSITTTYNDAGFAIRYGNGTNRFGNLTAGTQDIFSIVSSGGTYNQSLAYKNGTSIASQGSFNGGGTLNMQDNFFYLGGEKNAGSSQNLWDGYIQEFIVWDTDESANMLNIHTDVNSYYSAY